MTSSPTVPDEPVIAVAAPVRVRTRLAAADDGPRRVVHASPTAVYVDLDGWCLGLVSATASRVPCALWSTLPDLTDLDPVVRVRRGTLVVGGREARVTRLVDPRAARPRSGAGPTARPASGATTALAAAYDLPADGRLTPGHLDRLLGRGPGLTPLGDDVLAGWLAARTAAGAPDEVLAAAVRQRLGATTLLSATLLDCAIRGESLPQLADWLAAPTDASAGALLAVGATSGAGLLAGAELAIASLPRRTTPRRAA
ncbi:oxamate carbamoyltransferase subunit AllH family protein [Nocardioides xinjiangensis]|uniref:oxamate carbamoyltransferase subunit AllH family protein n=1 Tax=Nocardioides xinjiangensis TaxID=2817376 RepID=UPI001B310066|nr:DUF2877 domain-containing protein [Nocardioides sp. SYSU D00778]